MAGGIAILLLFLSEIISEEEPSTTTTEITGEQFTAAMEERLTKIIQHIDGAGQCRVMVTLENGVEYVYATQQKSGSNRVEDNNNESNRLSEQDDLEESIIIVDSNDGRKGLLVTTVEPIVKGVVVICEGGDREEVRDQVTQAVMTALHITSKRVYVAKLQH